MFHVQPYYVNIFTRGSQGEGSGGSSPVFPRDQVDVEWPVPAEGEDHQFCVQNLFNLDLYECCTLYVCA